MVSFHLFQMPYLFTNAEYAEKVFIFVYVMVVLATVAALVHQWMYPDHRIPNPKTICGTFLTMREIGSFLSTRTLYEWVCNMIVIDENIINAQMQVNAVQVEVLNISFRGRSPYFRGIFITTHCIPLSTTNISLDSTTRPSYSISIMSLAKKEFAFKRVTFL